MCSVHSLPERPCRHSLSSLEGHNTPRKTRQLCYYALSYPPPTLHPRPSSGTQGSPYIKETFCQGDPLNTLLKEKLAHSESPSGSTDYMFIIHKFYMNLSIVATCKTACLKWGHLPQKALISMQTFKIVAGDCCVSNPR